jgi:GT2 family glycosyltransferase
MIPKDYLNVVIPYKDRTENIAYCLASIAYGEYIPKTILVDFGNTHTLDVYKKRYPWLRIIHVQNRTKLFHKSRAMNIGIKQSKATFICATDADQVFHPKFFNFFILAARKLKRLILCKTYFLPKLPKNPPHNFMDNFNTYVKIARNYKPLRGEGCCIGLPRQWLIKVHGWDEQYYGYGAEDSDIIFRARCAGFLPENLHQFTAMIHLPHKRTTEYHSNAILKKNKHRYYIMKTKYKKGNSLVVNTDNNWGIL